MSDESLARRTLAFNPERMRATLWQDFAIPASLLQEAVDELQAQLHARKVEYFAWHGEVISKRVVKDNAARQSAIDKVLAMTGAYVRERDAGKQDNNTVTIEIGEDGVHRIIIGAAQSSLPSGDPPEREVLDVEPTNAETSLATRHGPSPAATHEEQPEIIRISKATPRENVVQLFKDPEPGTDGNGCID